MNINPFPNIQLQLDKEDANPAIQLFGRRFEKDQTEIEYLSEFLLVFVSRKEVGNVSKPDWAMSFPDIQYLKNWPNSDAELRYHASARLVLKLFSFLCSSKLETRHLCHRKHFDLIQRNLKENIETNNQLEPDQVLKLIEQVLLGFVAVAQNRTWCTQTFLPVSPNLIAAETIWRHKEAKKAPNLTWEESTLEFSKYYDFSKHRFMARGGELLYLQLCNLFRQQDNPQFEQFKDEVGYQINLTEQRERLNDGLRSLLLSLGPLDSISNWIESIDPDTSRRTDRIKTRCGWCPAESWQEAYLFSYEMVNICENSIDPLEKLEMLKICCVFQVLRSLCAQSARYWNGLAEDIKKLGSLNGYAWIISDHNCRNKALKDAAKTSFLSIQKLIHGALRSPELSAPAKGYRIADEQGHELFVRLGKRIGFIAPWKGPGARFVLPESLLRYFVLALIPPGNRMTLETFKEILYRHFGIAIGGEQLDRAIAWTYPNQSFTLRSKTDDWFEEKLRATGFLIPLSDSVSLVMNPFN